MRIGEVAQATDTSIETIRYYEREGLLPAPARSEGNYRIYEAAHVDRLLFIRHCRRLDMAQDEIRVLLRFKDAPQENCGEVDAVIDHHIEHVAARIDELKALQKHLLDMRSQCQHVQGASADCGLLQELTASSRRDTEAARGDSGHVGGTHGGKHHPPRASSPRGK
jgi:Cd(II)/Pb(II)-responsive transcriptional regulator